MPRYHNLPKNWEERGNYKITPRPFWRRLWPLKEIVPYHVGDRVKFHIHFDMQNIKRGHLSQVLYETFGNETKELCAINECDQEISGNILDKEGDIKYCIGYFSDQINSLPIFTTKVESWDTIISKWSWTFVGFLVSSICTIILWLLGFIKIIPKWQMWIR